MLREKLQSIFPSLHGCNFIVAWKDAEGDKITMSSDEELMLALTESQTEVRKLYLKPGAGSAEGVGGSLRQAIVHGDLVVENQSGWKPLLCTSCGQIFQAKKNHPTLMITPLALPVASSRNHKNSKKMPIFSI
ncbi:hypothetical protein L798_15366 [Zootermopsis nevadensis]|uniref:PB1 domain-containing protein n=1 Tax=Zootermopsis nevadensis TaxID=136037 RepID=A0A067QNL3_ZOONE|nr:hypothetical protein L798_15366 [Zootermopsis nevadensis]